MSEHGRLRAGPAEPMVRHVLEPFLRLDLGRYWEPLLWVQRAHAVMLAEQGILDVETLRQLDGALDDLEREGLPPDRVDPRLDLFFNIERELGRRVGTDAAGRLHTGRSRNDLQATYQRMAVRERLLAIAEAALALRAVCLDLAGAHAETLWPGYTHLQLAQPITLGHWALAVHDALARDGARLLAAYAAANRSPLGAGALAGTSWPIDRQRPTALLGFDGLLENTLDAVASRDYLVDAVAASAALLTTGSRCATDLLLWSSWEFGLVELDDAYAGISSIMPQKKNPVPLEHSRARAAQGIAALTSVLAVLKGTPFTHTLDTGKEAFHLVFDAFDQARSVAELLAGVLPGLRIHVERAAQASAAGFATATDLADTLVRLHGLSFRAAHEVVGTLVRLAIDRGQDHAAITPSLVAEAAVAVLGHPLHVPDEELRRALDPRANVEGRSLPGGPSPVEVRRMLAARRTALRSDGDAVARRRASLRHALEMCRQAAGATGAPPPSSG